MSDQVIFIRGMITSLPPDQAETVNELADHIRAVVKQAGPLGGFAVALVGAEMTDEKAEP